MKIDYSERPFITTVLWYTFIIIILSALAVNGEFYAGQCNVGLGVLAAILFFLISFVLMCIAIFKGIKRGGAFKLAMFIHIFFIGGLIVYSIIDALIHNKS